MDKNSPDLDFNIALLLLAGILICTIHLNQFYYSYDTIKWFVFDIALTILTVRLWPKSNTFSISYLGILFLLVLSSSLISLFYAPNLMMGIEFIMRFSLVFLSGYLLIHRYNKQQLLQILLNTVVLSALVFSVVFIIERYVLGHSYNVGSFSPIGFMNNTGQVFDIWIPCLVLYIFLHRKHYLKAIVATTILLFIVSLLMEAGTRGSIIGLALGEILVFILMLFQNRKKALYFLSITLLLASGMSIYKFSDDFNNGRLSGKITAMSNSISGSSGQRIEMFKNTWHMTLDNPLLGVGINNFEYIHPKYGKPGTSQASPFINEHQILRTPHNIVLKLYSELGLIGGSFFLLLLAYFSLAALFNAIKGTLIDKWLFVAVTATLFHSLVSAVFLTPASLFFACLLFTVIQSRLLDYTPLKSLLKISIPKNLKWGGLIIPVISICILTSAFYAHHGRLQFSDKLLNKALSFNPYNERALFTLSHVHYRKNRDTEKSLLIAEALLQINPYHIAALYIKCERQFQLNQLKLAKKSIKDILDIYPNYKKAQRLQQAIFQKSHQQSNYK